MTRIFRVAALAAVAALALSSCGGDDDGGSGGDKTKLTVFAASSLTNPFGELEKAFEEDHPDVDVVLSFDSSTTLATQITERLARRRARHGRREEHADHRRRRRQRRATRAVREPTRWLSSRRRTTRRASPASSNLDKARLRGLRPVGAVRRRRREDPRQRRRHREASLARARR